MRGLHDPVSATAMRGSTTVKAVRPKPLQIGTPLCVDTPFVFGDEVEALVEFELSGFSVHAQRWALFCEGAFSEFFPATGDVCWREYDAAHSDFT
jgi:hypothetical protein